jgi:hypothetical protein
MRAWAWAPIVASLIVVRNGPCAGADDAPAQKSANDKRAIDFDPDWTPRPAEGDAPPWEKETDVHWVDPRLREMDTGRTFNATFSYAYLPRKVTCFKGTAIHIGEQQEAAVLFDRNQLRWACAWTGGFLHHSDRRFGLLNTPAPAGGMRLLTDAGLGVSSPENTWNGAPQATAPLPRTWGRFAGMFRCGGRTVVRYQLGDGAQVDECPWVELAEGKPVFTRALHITGLRQTREFLIAEAVREPAVSDVHGIPVWNVFPARGIPLRVALVRDAAGCSLRYREGRLVLHVEPRDSVTVQVALGADAQLPEDVFAATVLRLREQGPGSHLAQWTRPGPPQWTENIVTRGVRAADDTAYVIDTLTVPYDNPYRALFFCSGVDFLPAGETVVSTAHGDVWLVSGVDRDLQQLTWKRFASGLYQPLGLKVVDGKIVVLERGQLTRLHDTNGDGTADFLECVNGDAHVGGGEHSFHTCLETDPRGNFYFFATGDTDTPTGGTLMKVSPDGARSEVFCTGFRHPIGLGVLPDGRVTGADQEGNWMPATRIDVFRRGGFYGDMRAHHRIVPPDIYDGPLCWLPRQVDNSAGGQVYVDRDDFGPLSRRYLHLSYGKCRWLLLMMQQCGDDWQGGAVDLGLTFLSGIQRGRFNPRDGHLYLAGMDGWQTAAQTDGCLQRVRYTGKKFVTPVELAVERSGVRLTFNEPLDRAFAGEVRRYHVEQWNYRWSGEYGSKRWSAANPEQEGQDEVPLETVTVSDDGKTVHLKLAALQPVMQMQIEYRLEDAAGEAVRGVVYNTVRVVPE